MMADRPLYHGLAGVMLDCNDPACDTCSLGPKPGESREDWIARLRDRFACQPLPDFANDTVAMQRYRGAPADTSPAVTTCAVRQGQCDETGVCQACVAAVRRLLAFKGSRTDDTGRLVCRRCGSERKPNTHCGTCAARMLRRRARA